MFELFYANLACDRVVAQLVLVGGAGNRAREVVVERGTSWHQIVPRARCVLFYTMTGDTGLG